MKDYERKEWDEVTINKCMGCAMGFQDPESHLSDCKFWDKLIVPEPIVKAIL
jgi:hypothetical protein